MPLLMDMHAGGDAVAPRDSAHAVAHAIATGPKPRGHHVHYLRYWVDESAGKIFCLVEADSAEDASTVHREAHGLVADEIYPVSEHS